MLMRVASWRKEGSDFQVFPGEFMGSMRRVLAVAVLLAGGAAAQAADLVEGYRPQCTQAAGVSLLNEESDVVLSDEVVRRMNEAVDVAGDSRWVYSRKPAFIWASEAKVACGKAYGYLKASYRDEDTIGKCECFHSRMLQYMN